MKTFILIAVLAALAIYNDAASIADAVPSLQEDVVEIRDGVEEYIKDYNLEVATGRVWGVDPDWILLHEEKFNVPGIPNTIQHRDVVFHANSTTRITSLRITFPPSPPGHLFAGNFGTHGHVSLTSAPGRGIGSIVQFYGVTTDSL